MPFAVLEDSKFFAFAWPKGDEPAMISIPGCLRMHPRIEGQMGSMFEDGPFRKANSREMYMYLYIYDPP